MIYPSATSDYLYKQIHLPHNSIILELKGFLYDTYAFSNTGVLIYAIKMDGTSQTSICQVYSSVEEASGFYEKTVSSVNHTVDNSQYCYYIKLVCDRKNGMQGIFGGRITYTTSDGLP
jgi:hypothetical protein